MNQEYRVLAKFVWRVQRGVYARQLLQGGIVLSTVLLAVLLLGGGIQLLIPLFPLAAPFYSAVTLLVLLFLGFYVLVPALRPVLQRRALTDIEHTYPDLHDDLTNALELEPEALQRSNPRGVALELVQALHQHTARKLAGCCPRTVVRRHRLLGLSWSGVLLLATIGVMLLQPHMLSESLRLMTQPLSYLPPRQVHIAITPERVTMARGTNLAVRAQASGRLPRAMQIRVTRPGQRDKIHPMEAGEAGEFRYTFLKPQTSFTFHATAGAFTSPPGSVAIVPSPAIGKMTLHYLFPDYTGLPPRTQEGGGSIQALLGTQVQMRLQANVPLSKGVLRFDHGSELPLDVADDTLQGEILVMKEGTYVVVVQDRHGLKNLQPPRYTVQVLNDRLPTVHILQPQDGLEVDETTALRLHYEAEDDFGLQDASLVYFGAAATEQRIPLWQGHFAHRRLQETFIWDIGQWPLPAGDTVQFYLEVYDNDTISGPKKGVSQTLTLKVRNREQEHEELERLQEEIADALLDLLGDHLELAEQLQEWREPSANDATPSQEALQQTQALQRESRSRAEQLGDRLREALEQIQRDPYSTYETFADMQTLQRNLTHLNHSLLPQLQKSLQSLVPQQSPAQLAQPEERLEEVVEELERLSSLADNIASGEKFNDLMNIGNKMMEQQHQLLAALDNLPKDFEGGELPPGMRDMLAQLDALMQELAEAMSQLPTSMSDEFLNQQLNALPLTDMMQQLQEMQQKLAAGDLEGARRLGESLLKALSSMVSALHNMMQQARGGPMEAMSQQLQQSSDRLSDLIQRQERVLENTQEIDQEALRQLNQSQQRAFDRLHPALQQDMSQLTKLARELSRQARQHPKLAQAFQRAYPQLLKHLQALRQNFAARDMPQARQDLEAAQRQLTWMQRQLAHLPQPDKAMQQRIAETLAHLQAARQRIDRLPWDRQAMLTPAQRAQLGALGEQQDGVQRDTQELHRAFEELLPLMPFLSSEMGQNLQEALPFMGQAQSELDKRRSQPAIPPEQQALEHLRQAQNSLQQAMQQMGQRGQMMGLSVPMLRQAGRLPNLIPQPSSSQPSGGTAGASMRNFQLPDKEAYKVPRIFREDIVEALKEGYPERYKGLIEQYYRNIVR
ncbi:hypothetical protein NKDENANG_02863 [Candidatus Entotheonellaceae bacterium PAL068K]